MIYTLDDDESFNFILKKSIETFGIQVKTHLHSADFTASVKQMKPDLCIIDINLDHMGEGFQLLKAIRNVIGDKLPVIVMSKRAEQEDVQKVMAFGANDFLPKPLDDHYLFAKLVKYYPDNTHLKGFHFEELSVAAHDVDGKLYLPFKLLKIDGLKFEIEGDHFLVKDSDIIIEGGFAKQLFNKNEMTFRVLDSFQNPKTKK